MGCGNSTAKRAAEIRRCREDRETARQLEADLTRASSSFLHRQNQELALQAEEQLASQASQVSRQQEPTATPNLSLSRASSSTSRLGRSPRQTNQADLMRVSSSSLDLNLPAMSSTSGSSVVPRGGSQSSSFSSTWGPTLPSRVSPSPTLNPGAARQASGSSHSSSFSSCRGPTPPSRVSPSPTLNLRAARRASASSHSQAEYTSEQLSEPTPRGSARSSKSSSHQGGGGIQADFTSEQLLQSTPRGSQGSASSGKNPQLSPRTAQRLQPSQDSPRTAQLLQSSARSPRRSGQSQGPLPRGSHPASSRTPSERSPKASPRFSPPLAPPRPPADSPRAPGPPSPHGFPRTKLVFQSSPRARDRAPSSTSSDAPPTIPLAGSATPSPASSRSTPRASPGPGRGAGSAGSGPRSGLTTTYFEEAYGREEERKDGGGDGPRS